MWPLCSGELLPPREASPFLQLYWLPQISSCLYPFLLGYTCVLDYLCPRLNSNFTIEGRVADSPTSFATLIEDQFCHLTCQQVEFIHHQWARFPCPLPLGRSLLRYFLIITNRFSWQSTPPEESKLNTKLAQRLFLSALPFSELAWHRYLPPASSGLRGDWRQVLRKKWFSILPSKVTAQIGAAFMVASSSGADVFPLLVGQLVEDLPMGCVLLSSYLVPQPTCSWTPSWVTRQDYLC